MKQDKHSWYFIPEGKDKGRAEFNDARNNQTDVQTESLSEKEKEIVKTAADALVKNYVDEAGNLKKYKQIYMGSKIDLENADFQIIDAELETMWEKYGKKSKADEFESLQNILQIPEMQKELMHRFFDQTADLKSRIISAQIIHDLAYLFIDEEGGRNYFLDKIEDFAKEEKKSFFHQLYLNFLKKDCEALLTDQDYAADDYQEKRLFGGKEFFHYHNNQFDDFKLQLPLSAVSMINSAVHDGHYLQELQPIEKTTQKDIWGEADEEAYLGDYIISPLSPRWYGVYARDGHLSAAFEKNQVKEKTTQKKENDESRVIQTSDIEELLKDFRFDNPGEDVFLLKLLLSLPMREEIKKEIGFDMAELELKNQYYFLQFIAKKDSARFENVRQFVLNGKTEIDKINRIKAFLALEQDPGMGEVILDIARDLAPEEANMIFAKYAEIADTTYNISEAMIALIKDPQKRKNIDAKALNQDLLKRGKGLFDFFAQEIQNGKAERRTISTDSINNALKQYQRDSLFMASALKYAKEYGLEFEDFEGAKFQALTLAEIIKQSETEISEGEEGEKSILEQMREMYRFNWQSKPAIMEAALQKFGERVQENPEQIEMFLMKRDKEVLAFSGAEPVGENKVHFFGLNVKHTLQTSKLAWFLKDISVKYYQGETIEHKKAIEIECDPGDFRATPLYINKDGYVGTGITKEFGDALLLKAVKDPNEPAYRLRNMPEEEIIRIYMEELATGENTEGIKNEKIVKFEIGSLEMEQTLERYLSGGQYVMTRYILAKNKRDVYAVFEPSAGLSGGKES
jgi:hypothetical protein